MMNTNKIEAHGVKGMKSTAWRKTFASIDALNKWVEKNDAEVYATRNSGHGYANASQARQYLRSLSPGNRAAHKLLDMLNDEQVIACAIRRGWKA